MSKCDNSGALWGVGRGAGSEDCREKGQCRTGGQGGGDAGGSDDEPEQDGAAAETEIDHDAEGGGRGAAGICQPC